ncbi:TPA: NAD-dependent succinate-semialdehyde dehydrogenase [Acinetobacter baumannii]|jgi:succinate-semialdehyde dehydrogenase/glutarate-semialdehyde dehydrogenase|uniref:Succinate-semialdehyde dehydrogenase [NADP(+)] GabD n=21 Tax=Gammaproteobacteria TaxID=1236 RepID=A0ABX6CKA2_ACIB2|nr:MULTISPECIES: NAD-dependent succinate-semialdehyde dehydrogenase [Acinetobacter]ARN29353.1 succinate-semialdehyde dehydrogenase (NADP(+)) [Acinetobacter baumannii]AUT32802.1 NAD-dependent succinate-semialdehyde dehydrogenase [Acinetobacter pittii]AVN16874.1 NAD-dependent succinate-semialdehyde dehydrogenase [Acinetobacter pittii]AVN20613.1 NAD-dependent succinate-semialdehyde dehydrogenase [Acinetobacter pittii]AXJ89527.1 NAD-dependent succinate-semialdehyde dehydrogenase [Acinetobacter pit
MIQNNLQYLLKHPDISLEAPASNDYIEVNDAATGETLAWVKTYDRAGVEAAINRSAKAQAAWKKQTALARADVLLAWYNLMLEHKENLAQILTAEQGKPLAEARGEIGYAASFIRWFAEQARRIDGEVLTPTLPNQRLLVIKQAIGVTAAITPWNFPAAMITRKAGPAIAAGCSMLVKPAEQTPLTAYALEVLALQAGLPADVLINISGDAVEVGKTLCESDIVRKLSFTGSTQVGRILMQQCAPTIKKLSLELGGNAPVVVFDDANLEQAVQGIMASKYRNSGQTCVCANRIYVQDGIYDALAERLVEAVSKLKVGDGRQEGSTQGPLIDEDAIAKVQSHIADATEKGATVRIGGQRSALGGTFFEPTVLTGVTQDMKVSKEETFGPLAPLFRFKTEDEAVAMANDTEFGLAAYLFTQSTARQWRVGEALEYGMVGINTGAISNEVAPFGGVKQSGLGREGSKFGIEEYVEMKYLCVDLSE